MSGFRHLGDEPLLDMSRGRIARGSFEAPDGTTFQREIARQLEVVAVVPLHSDGTVTLVRQYRGALDAELLEVPAGLCDEADEVPEVTALRELREEAGLEPQDLKPLAKVHPSPGFSDQLVHIFLATGVYEVEPDRQGPEEEAMTVERISLDDVPAMVRDGRLTDAKSIVGLLSLHHKLNQT